MDALAADGELAGYHLLPAARADLLRRLGRLREAADAYREALALAGNETERRFLERRLAQARRRETSRSRARSARLRLPEKTTVAHRACGAERLSAARAKDNGRSEKFLRNRGAKYVSLHARRHVFHATDRQLAFPFPASA